MFTTDLVAFLESGCALIVATAGDDGAPHASRGWGLDVLDATTGRIRLLLGADDPVVLAHAAAGGGIAVTGADVVTLRSVQAKGRVLSVEPVTSDDRERSQRYCTAYHDAVAIVDDIPRHLMQRMVPVEMVRCDIEVEAVFDQTPGPGAGAEIAGADRVSDRPALAALERCFTGVVPAVIATAAADGTPNVTYLSRVHPVDGERIALSNQFFSKTQKNLAENPRGSLLLVDPTTHDEYRLALVYERTECEGPLFDRLAADIDAVAAMTGMQDVFRLRAADIYRIADLEQVIPNPDAPAPEVTARRAPDTVAVGELCGQIARCPDLGSLVSTLVDGLDQVLGYHHVHLLLAAEDGRSLYTMASRGFDAESVGAEVAVGDGVIGMAAQRGAAMRVGNLGQMAKYSRSIQRAWEVQHGEEADRAVPMPGLPGAQSRVAVPALALGQLVGVLSADSTTTIAFGPEDEAALSVVASLFAHAYETLPRRGAGGRPGAGLAVTGPPPDRSRPRPRALLHRRRQHLPRRRVPHQGGGRPHPLGPARRARARRSHRVHQQGAATRPEPGDARVQGQPREPAHPAHPPPRRAPGPDHPDPHRTGPLPHGRGPTPPARGRPLTAPPHLAALSRTGVDPGGPGPRNLHQYEGGGAQPGVAPIAASWALMTSWSLFTAWSGRTITLNSTIRPSSPTRMRSTPLTEIPSTSVSNSSTASWVPSTSRT